MTEYPYDPRDLVDEERMSQDRAACRFVVHIAASVDPSTVDLCGDRMGVRLLVPSQGTAYQVEMTRAQALLLARCIQDAAQDADVDDHETPLSEVHW